MTLTIQILITAAVAAPVIGIIAMVEVLGTDSGVFSALLVIDVFVIMVCLAILGYQTLITIW